MFETPSPSSDRRFVVKAGDQDPTGQHHHDRERRIAHELNTSRTAANRAARVFLRRGLWVEIYDDDTRELLAGPFDPDQTAPAYIV